MYGHSSDWHASNANAFATIESRAARLLFCLRD